MEAFYPWVGAKYNSDSIFKKKIFILGESVYCEEPDDCGACYPGAMNLCNYFIIHIVLENMFGYYKTPLYTKIYKLLVDENHVSKIDFWNSISFGNFVQTSVSSKARVRPSQTMWEEAAKIFAMTLERLLPDKMIVLGNELWDHLPGSIGEQWEMKQNNNELGVAIFDCKIISKKIEVAVIGHPQRFGFDYSESKVLRDFINT